LGHALNLLLLRLCTSVTLLFWGLLSSHAVAQSTARQANAYSAQIATEWMLLATQLIQQTPGFSPPIAARALGYLGLTLYESVAPGMPDYRSLAGQLNELQSLPTPAPDEPLHWPSVANAALATMSRLMFSNASLENKNRIDLLERNLPLKLSQDFEPVNNSIELGQRSQSFGRLLAMAINTWARTDGGHEAWAPLRRSQAVYVPPSGDGKWVPTPPAFAPALLPYWANVRPFALKTNDQCAAKPPPSYSESPESAFYKEAAEVLGISKTATQEQRQVAIYWADDPVKTATPAGHWVFIASDLLNQEKAPLDKAALTFAQLNLSLADAFIAAWQAKYLYSVMRPVTYIQIAIESSWVPSLMTTPPFPEYPSGHSVQSSAAALVLNRIFGEQTSFTDNTHNDRGWGPRTFKSFNAAATEASMSRLYAGIHFRASVEAGQAQGSCVGKQILALKFKQK
jgi:membrane-associated phospholipid phosphatase